MTKEDAFFALANAPMSAPDRLQGLMDAAAKHQDFAEFRRSLLEQLETTDTASPVGEFIGDKIDETVEFECLALEEVNAWVSALLNDGTLEDCRGFLANRDQFQRAVERNKRDRARTVPRTIASQLLARFWGVPKTDQPPSPTR